MEPDPIVVYLAIALAGRIPLTAETTDDRSPATSSSKATRTKTPTRTARQRAPRPNRKG